MHCVIGLNLDSVHISMMRNDCCVEPRCLRLFRLFVVLIVALLILHFFLVDPVHIG